jgi:uncharacterized integral membrane protein
MTDAGPTPSAHPTPTPPETATGPTASEPPSSLSPAPPSARPSKEGLGHTRTSSFWAAVVALVVLLVLLAVFVLQNVQQVEISYFGWQGQAPLASALLIAAASGALIVVVAGTLRIMQLRRRVRRAQRH